MHILNHLRQPVSQHIYLRLGKQNSTVQTECQTCFDLEAGPLAVQVC